MKRFIILFFTAIVCIFTLIIAGYAVEDVQTVRVGLYYGSGALPSANLANEVGSGYKFGYFDSGYAFVAVGSTDEEKITVMKDANIYLGGDGLYYDTLPSSGNGVIGAYHLQADKTFYTYQEAKRYADSLSYSAFPFYNGSSYKVRIGSYQSSALAESAKTAVSAASGASVSVVGSSGTCYTVTKTKTEEILFEFDMGGQAFGIMPVSSSKAQTWFKGYCYYGNFCYSRSGGNISVVNYVSLEDYVKGVLPYEMSASWEKEALKAQAVCARSYAYNNLNKHKSLGFDLCNTTNCQVYRGTSSSNANSDQAVDETAGKYITYGGAIATGFFHSSDGGATESSENVWGSPVGYLKGKIDPYEDQSINPNASWTATVTNEQLASILKSKNYTLTGVQDLYVGKYTEVGNVYQLCVVTTDGKVINLEKEKARTALTDTARGVNIKSIRYKVTGGSGQSGTDAAGGTYYVNGSSVPTSTAFYAQGADGIRAVNSLSGRYALTSSGVESIGSPGSMPVNGQPSSSGTYTITGSGWGHNVGMSQYGAKSMARKGYSYEDILKFYFTNVEISTAQ